MSALPIDTHVHLDEMAAVDLDAAPYRAALVPGITAEKTAATIARWGMRRELVFAAGAHPWFLPPSPPPRHGHRSDGQPSEGQPSGGGPSDGELGKAEGGQRESAGPARRERGHSPARALVDLWDHPRVEVVGEMGLDHLRHTSATERAHAARWCGWQLQQAAERGLPVVLHVVRAHEDMLALLRDCDRLTGFVHAFGGSVEQAVQYQALGIAVGLGAAVTRERSTRVRRVAAEVAADGYVLETDAPFMAVAPAQRGCGTPGDILAVASAVAEVRGVPVGQVVDESTQNAIDRVASLSLAARCGSTSARSKPLSG